MNWNILFEKVVQNPLSDHDYEKQQKDVISNVAFSDKE